MRMIAEDHFFQKPRWWSFPATNRPFARLPRADLRRAASVLDVARTSRVDL